MRIESSGVSEQTPYSAWAFCGGGAVGDELAQLVLAGTKTATASALLAFELEQEPLPKVGEYSVILLDSGEAAGVICDTKVTLVPFDEVSGARAYREGEGDRSLAYWKKVHRKAFTPDFEAAGEALRRAQAVRPGGICAALSGNSKIKREGDKPSLSVC